MHELTNNIERDFVAWDNKTYDVYYTERSLLNRADGEIMRYRRICTQFYPEYAGTKRAGAHTTRREAKVGAGRR